MPKKETYLPQLLVLRIKMADIRPMISRNILVRNTLSFDKLHLIIQIAMGWENYHLYQFMKGDIMIDNEADEAMMFSRFKRMPSRTTPIAAFLNAPKDKIKYEYDFGDSWLHEISVSKVLPDDPEIKNPVCQKASRACPPEDCGGVGGYYEIMEMLNGEDIVEEEDNLREWLGEDYDPEFVDIEDINKLLKKIKM
ncbi:MAG: plasmid pRiA4b ORF-3 family protein [Candidatus Cloacimonetes bacterium]|nr:plasmid pRiA4b ORF-3 family protein [Candidatus Cloacimonadota bacterium]